MAHRESPKTLRVLLAEDDDALRAFHASTLEFCGYEVIPVPTGIELAHVISSWITNGNRIPPIDVLVTDARMRGFDELGVVVGMACSKWHLPTVVLAAAAEAHSRLDRLHHLDGVTFLPRGAGIDDLEDSIRHVTRDPGSTTNR